ncbi:sensor histidine kinase [Clostridium thermarum]|uniref:sensor histidine kinase n=1 Tax=Clostridium thermarum TaxID=1716543 RepID=UPI0013D0CA8F|nr:HAMP domain-containing sensor histidine kinase [Clostridium thermarum]
MNIKRRLIYSNTLTIIIPLFISFVIAIAVINITSLAFKRDINYENFKELVSVKTELLHISSGIAKQKINIIENNEYKEYLLQRLSTIQGEFILTQNDSLVFSSGNITKIDLEKCLEASKSGFLSKSIKIKGRSQFIQVVEHKFKDGTTGKIILLAPINEKSDFLFNFILLVGGVFVLSFISINIFMAYLMSKRILKPVTLLKKAASEISSGNLNYEVIEDGDEEIKELCKDFEQMRLQLKDSVHEKMLYDDNRKMLVSSISHDLKTPITSIKGYVEGILDGVAATPEKINEYLKTIYSKASQVDLMIDDLLLYSKLDLHQLPFNFECTNIIQYFEYCISDCAEELRRSGIEITLENNLTNSKFVLIDRERMRRVITNIIDNSRKYMNKEKGQIKIILRETNSSILAEIRDNGSGISKDEVNQIFDRFYRANKARTGTDGSGLGLAIAKQIVEGHLGKIWAISHGNDGTSIIISLAKMEGVK